MKSKKKIAIETLRKHKEKLRDLNNHTSNWYAMLSDLLSKYLGKDSLLYNSARGWYSNIPRGSSDHLDSANEIIDNAIEFIQANGVLKPNSIWRRIESMNQKVVYTIITGMLGLSFWIGYEFSNIRQVKNENKMIIENQKLKKELEGLSFTPSIEIPNPIPDSNSPKHY